MTTKTVACWSLIFILFVAALTAAPAASAQDAIKQITFGEKRDVDPAVSPDGKFLIFSSNRTGTYNLFTASLNDDKAGFTQVTQGKKDDRFPCWALDSKRVYFSSRRTGNGDLYETSLDGASGFLQLTESDSREECPAINPKTGELIFSRAPKQMIKVAPKLEIVLRETKGNPLSPIVLAEGDEPRFAPDAKRIAFVSHRTKNNDIWLMNPDGAQQTQLTTDPKDDVNPAFSPDGSKIVFASKRAGNFDIWMMNADGTGQRQLTTSPQDETQPFWSMGGYIYFSRRASESQSNIFRMPAP